MHDKKAWLLQIRLHSLWF